MNAEERIAEAFAHGVDEAPEVGRVLEGYRARARVARRRRRRAGAVGLAVAIAVGLVPLATGGEERSPGPAVTVPPTPGAPDPAVTVTPTPGTPGLTPQALGYRPTWLPSGAIEDGRMTNIGSWAAARSWASDKHWFWLTRYPRWHKGADQWKSAYGKIDFEVGGRPARRNEDPDTCGLSWLVTDAEYLMLEIGEDPECAVAARIARSVVPDEATRPPVAGMSVGWTPPGWAVNGFAVRRLSGTCEEQVEFRKISAGGEFEGDFRVTLSVGPPQGPAQDSVKRDLPGGFGLEVWEIHSDLLDQPTLERIADSVVVTRTPDCSWS